MATGYTAGRMVAHNMVTTQFEVDGFRVTRTLGVVRGIVVRSRSIFGTIGAGLQTLVGGNITLLTNLCEKTRQERLLIERRNDNAYHGLWTNPPVFNTVALTFPGAVPKR
jgi:hypothetical protein